MARSCYSFRCVITTAALSPPDSSALSFPVLKSRNLGVLPSSLGALAVSHYLDSLTSWSAVLFSPNQHSSPVPSPFIWAVSCRVRQPWAQRASLHFVALATCRSLRPWD